jgi:putative membrane protein
MKRTAIVLSCLLLATPVLAQSVGEKTGVNSTLGISPSTQDFITQVAISDLFEINTSKLAQSKGNPGEKAFAEQMIADHTKTSGELKRMVNAGANNTNKIDVPSQMDSAHQGKYDKLKDLTGADFSATYASQQVDAHKDAVNLFERYAKGGDHAELKDWAGKTLPALKHHLEMAQKLDDARSSSTVGTKK